MVMLVGLRERMPSMSCFGRDMELLTLAAQKLRLRRPWRGMTPALEVIVLCATLAHTHTPLAFVERPLN